MPEQDVHTGKLSLETVPVFGSNGTCGKQHFKIPYLAFVKTFGEHRMALQGRNAFSAADKRPVNIQERHHEQDLPHQIQPTHRCLRGRG